jgi:hypothetical protein
MACEVDKNLNQTGWQAADTRLTRGLQVADRRPKNAGILNEAKNPSCFFSSA